MFYSSKQKSQWKHLNVANIKTLTHFKNSHNFTIQNGLKFPKYSSSEVTYRKIRNTYHALQKKPLCLLHNS